MEWAIVSVRPICVYRSRGIQVFFLFPQGFCLSLFQQKSGKREIRSFRYRRTYQIDLKDGDIYVHDVIG